MSKMETFDLDNPYWKVLYWLVVGFVTAIVVIGYVVYRTIAAVSYYCRAGISLVLRLRVAQRSGSNQEGSKVSGM